MTRLTNRELEVLHLMGTGKTNKEIATILFLSVRSVNNHAHSINIKLGVATRTQAVIYALAANLFSSAKIEEILLAVKNSAKYN